MELIKCDQRTLGIWTGISRKSEELQRCTRVSTDRCVVSSHQAMIAFHDAWGCSCFKRFKWQRQKAIAILKEIKSQDDLCNFYRKHFTDDWLIMNEQELSSIEWKLWVICDRWVGRASVTGWLRQKADTVGCYSIFWQHKRPIKKNLLLTVLLHGVYTMYYSKPRTNVFHLFHHKSWIIISSDTGRWWLMRVIRVFLELSSVHE